MTRFIISPNQAVELVFDALKYGIGGEVFVPKLPAFKIVDLIEILKEKHGANNEISLIGVRPGEKIHEIMINRGEVPRTFKFKDRFVITSCIGIYQEIKNSEYFTGTNQLSEQEMDEYSSNDAVIDKNDVKELFKSLRLL